MLRPSTPTQTLPWLLWLIFISLPQKALAEQYASRAASVDEIFADNDIDAVLIASSTPTHAEYLERAARAGKAILCEKPIALDLARTRNALQVLSEHPVTCALGFNRRHDPQFAALKKRLPKDVLAHLKR
ncbi:hypothetical protein HORIV_64750 [Vreelandella olivaria]|uniref:Gfo/Idh/MocA-like oxidoreductase N-terminal domain-containing protein n=1 Tax=Vreelandella olivaria TaxID=390919 RepID=A0ABM7GSH2_9GAMM|nr:hypothetical protein HORIV_64750 [Halomonas olivaria]